MSLRDLVDADCGGANALMRLGSHFAQDIAHKEDGISRGFGAANSFYGRDAIHGEASGADQLVNEFLGQSGPMHPPQTFRMDALLQEMREIDAGKFSPQHMRAPAVIEEVRNEAAWANEFRAQESTVGPLVGIPGVLSSTNLPMAPRHDQLMAMGNTKSMVANDFFNSMDAVSEIFFVFFLLPYYLLSINVFRKISFLRQLAMCYKPSAVIKTNSNTRSLCGLCAT